MVWFTREFNHILAGLFFSTIAWNLVSISMSLHEWRVWYMDDPLFSYTTIAFVGMWETCVYNPEISGRVLENCYVYTTPVPLDIMVSQHFLQTGKILSLFSHVCAVLMLVNRLHMGRGFHGVYNPFVLPGIINMIVSGCVFFAFLINYNAVMKMEGIDFPSSIPLPFKPDIQDIGSALILAGIGSFLFLLSGNIFFTYPIEN